MVGRFNMHRKLTILFKMSVCTPTGRNPLGAVGGDEVILKSTSIVLSVRTGYEFRSLRICSKCSLCENCNKAMEKK